MINKELLWNDLKKIRETSPLVHNITNYVVMNNTANALLSLGASPIMAHALDEVADIASISAALVINIGTLSNEWIDAMMIAGKTASSKGIPVVLDPVGAGATNYRTNTCLQIIKECKPSIIRGNASEILALTSSINKTKGVDSVATSESAIDAAQWLAHEYNTVVTISGAIDYITDGSMVEEVKNGSVMMTKVTGLGCTASALTGAFAAVNRNYLQAATHAMAVMGIAGEMAVKKSNGPGSLQVHFLDTLFNLSFMDIEQTLIV